MALVALTLKTQAAGNRDAVASEGQGQGRGREAEWRPCREPGEWGGRV